MIEEENTEQHIVGELIKKSLIRVPSDDFTDRLMEKIESVKAHEKVSFLSMKLSWSFLTLAVILVPISLRLITASFHQTFLTPYIHKISPVILLLFSFLVLLQLDNLLKTFFVRKKFRALLGTNAV
jgi:hypothetical protein